MAPERTNKVAIVDYGLGNLFSIKQACQEAGITTEITSEADRIEELSGIILPGVGAFGDAVNALQEQNLFSCLKTLANSDKPFLGICLGMQLLMETSYEFGEHEGLSIIEGDVVRFDQPTHNGRSLPVPQVSWNQLHHPVHDNKDWKGTILNELPEDAFMYFVHSYYPRPSKESVCVSETTYGDIKFCSTFEKDNVIGCQFHPERSGPDGIKIYKNFKNKLTAKASR